MSKKPKGDDGIPETAEPPPAAPFIDLGIDGGPAFEGDIPEEPIFQPDAQKIAEFRRTGTDPTDSHWNIQVWTPHSSGKGGQWARIPGMRFPSSKATISFFESLKLPPGSYSCQMMNAQGRVLWRRHLEGSVQAFPGTPGTPAAQPAGGLLGALLGGNTAASGGIGDRILEALVVRLLDPPKREEGSMAEMMKLMITDQQLHNRRIEQSLDIAERHKPEKNGSEDRLFSLLEKQVLVAKENGSKGSSSLQEAMPILNLGISMGLKMSGAKPGTDEREAQWWDKLATPEMVESIAVPMMGIFANMFPKDKAEAINKIILEHLKVQKADIDAGPNVVDTEGQEVKIDP